MGSPYREDAAALREHRDAIARELDESEASVAKLSKELEAIDLRLSLRPLNADDKRPKKLSTVLAVTGAPVIAVILVHWYTGSHAPNRPRVDPAEEALYEHMTWMNLGGHYAQLPPSDAGARGD